jgi:hypothetical protein
MVAKSGAVNYMDARTDECLEELLEDGTTDILSLCKHVKITMNVAENVHSRSNELSACCAHSIEPSCCFSK